MNIYQELLQLQQPDSASKHASKQDIMKMRTIHGNDTYFSHTYEAPVGTFAQHSINIHKDQIHKHQPHLY
jgi:hypothetical protein